MIPEDDGDEHDENMTVDENMMMTMVMIMILLVITALTRVRRGRES